MTPTTTTTKKITLDDYLKVRSGAKEALLEEYKEAITALEAAIEKVEKEHAPKIEKLKTVLSDDFNHVFPEDKESKKGKKSSGSRQRTDYKLVVAEINKLLANGKKMISKDLISQLGIKYSAFQKVLKDNPKLLSITDNPANKLAKFYSLK
jgi:hypothetical protein